ncbi:Ppx/GppA phosphatase family protein [uncultured Sphingomonas sp.]|uniref:Ppx/GppA phosphatase family protein n=1 Tax=uncultured Sphingomonas sp. TaxID=158754 RepID=UPI0035CAAB36
MGDVPASLPYRPDTPAPPAPHAPARAEGRRDGGREGSRGEPRHFAALDLGTNNCRLLIARPAGSERDGGFTVVDAFSRVVRLGEGLAATGRLSDAAVDRTIAALKICADKLRRRHVLIARSVATEACRRATNGPAFVARALAETGIHLDVISAEEEARLAVLGCHALIEPGDDPALVFDIGGGSTELVLVDTGDNSGGGAGERPRVLDWHSAPWGVVSLTESAGGGATAEERAIAYARMRAVVADAMAPFAARLPRGIAQPRLLGTSGTVTTLASVHLGLPHYDRSAIDGLVVPAESMRAISMSLAGMSVAERATLPCIGTERADLVVAGCAILETIMDLWPAQRIGIADRGIREGILKRLMGEG